MKTLIIKFCLPILILVNCLSAFAANPTITADTKAKMIPEIQRGNSEVLNCISGKKSDKQIVECVSKVLDVNIGNETDTAPFLAGAYFAGWANLIASNPTDGIKAKWLATYFRRFSEIQKDIGFSDKELCEITNNPGILPY
jgi:hypothetical protein